MLSNFVVKLYSVAFDTGSSDLFVPSSNCDPSCTGHKTYDPSSSSSSQDLGRPFELHYGDGSSASGEQYSDVVNITGLIVCAFGSILSTEN
jgi:cathepsin D